MQGEGLLISCRVSIPVDKVRAQEGGEFKHYYLRFQSPWIRFAPRSLGRRAPLNFVSIPVDKVRAKPSLRVWKTEGVAFQSPWIRFARSRRLCYRSRPLWFQSPWIRFARDALEDVCKAIVANVSIPVDKVRAVVMTATVEISSLFQSPWIRFAPGRVPHRPREDRISFNPRG